MKNELIWLAGLTDGEGCIRIVRQKANRSNRQKHPTYYPYFFIAMTHKDTILKIHEIVDFKGTVMEHDKRKTKKKQWSRCWKWQVSCNDAVEVLRTLQPYLVTKQKECDLMLRFADLPKFRNQEVPPEALAQRESFYLEMKRQKQAEKQRWLPNDS